MPAGVCTRGHRDHAKTGHLSGEVKEGWQRQDPGKSSPKANEDPRELSRAEQTLLFHPALCCISDSASKQKGMA